MSVRRFPCATSSTRRFGAAPAAVCFLVGVLGASQVRAGELVRLGPELQVNSYTTGAQHYPAVAMDADGDFVVVWYSVIQDGSGAGVFGRRFNSTGTALATEFQVNVFTASSQIYPSVGMDDGGDFVVAWQSYTQDGAGNAIMARRYSANGTSLASEFLVNSYVTAAQEYAAASMDADGDFVIVWQSSGQDGDQSGIFARRFDSGGIALATEFQVTLHTVNAQLDPVVAMHSAGGFVVAWESYVQDGDSAGVFARRFSSAGVPLASEFQLSSFTVSAQRDPVLDFDAGGGFVAAWSSNSQDGQGSGVFARRFSSAGGPVGAEFLVNATIPGSQVRPAIGVAGDGALAVAWQVDQDGSLEGIFARRFGSTGTGGSAEFQVNSYTIDNQYTPVLAMENGGDFVVAWYSEDQDGSSTGIFAQRLRAVANLDVDGNGTISPLTDGLLTLRYEFGFSGATLIVGAIDLAGCTRCTAPAIEEYLASQR